MNIFVSSQVCPQGKKLKIVISHFELISNEFVWFLFVMFPNGVRFLKRKEKKQITLF